MEQAKNRLILLVDDLEEMHDNFREILTREASAAGDRLAAFEEGVFSEARDRPTVPSWTLDSAFQGEQAVEMVYPGPARRRYSIRKLVTA